jgi:hypothetical protein
VAWKDGPSIEHPGSVLASPFQIAIPERSRGSEALQVVLKLTPPSLQSLTRRVTAECVDPVDKVLHTLEVAL